MTAASIIMSKGRDGIIERAAVSTGAAGGQGYAFATHLTSVKLFRQPASGNESQKYGAVRAQIAVVFFALHGQDITAKDRILLDGIYYDIESVLSVGGTGCEHLEHLEITAIETKGVPV